MNQLIKFKINGENLSLEVPTNYSLLTLIREKLQLTGTKCGCDEGDCGACTVLLDGKAVNSCLVLAALLDGREVLTIEGLKGTDGQLHPIQRAFAEVGAVQCGFCTPGMILTAKAFLDQNPSPTEAEVRSAISGNLCRCTGYKKIVQAILLAADYIKTQTGEV